VDAYLDAALAQDGCWPAQKSYFIFSLNLGISLGCLLETQLRSTTVSESTQFAPAFTSSSLIV
jgi:hypothetical protein